MSDKTAEGRHCWHYVSDDYFIDGGHWAKALELRDDRCPFCHQPFAESAEDEERGGDD